jgi:hypothetical protein
MGRPSCRSDVFSAGLILYRMFSGQLPEWPFEWPMPGHDRLRRVLTPEFISFIRRAISVPPSKRFADCNVMLRAFQALRSKALRTPARRSRRTDTVKGKDWREVRWKQSVRTFGKELGARHDCSGCGGPVAEAMSYCPWCKRDRRIHRGPTALTRRCPRCKRGMKGDWRYCAWCFGKGLQPTTTRDYPDKRYTGRCSNESCGRRELMPFMRYCPWCHAKVRREWKLNGSKSRCQSCRWGVAGEYWKYCPWCSKTLRR